MSPKEPAMDRDAWKLAIQPLLGFVILIVSTLATPIYLGWNTLLLLLLYILICTVDLHRDFKTLIERVCQSIVLQLNKKSYNAPTLLRVVH